MVIIRIFIGSLQTDDFYRKDFLYNAFPEICKPGGEGLNGVNVFDFNSMLRILAATSSKGRDRNILIRQDSDYCMKRFKLNGFTVGCGGYCHGPFAGMVTIEDIRLVTGPSIYCDSYKIVRYRKNVMRLT